MAGAAVRAAAGRPTKLRLNLFEDAVFTAIIDPTAPTLSGYSLSGRREEKESDTITLVVNGTVVAGSVYTPSGTYRVRSIGAALYAISEVDESRLPPARILNHSWPLRHMTAVYNRWDKLPEMDRALQRWGECLEQMVTA